MQRRRLVSLAAASAVVAASAPTRAGASSADAVQQAGDLGAAIGQFLELPGDKSYVVHVGQGGSIGRIAHRPKLFLFTASAYKTFVLGQYLRDVEAGLLSEDEPLALNDSVRNIGSPVFIDLSGELQARSVLDAMMGYSDNTATDMATAKVGADRVRALIAAAGLSSIRIPDSTRLFASYVFGAPPNVDLGWPGIRQAAENPPGMLRPPLNDVITLAGTARDFVSWYEQALAGAFFAKPETLAEFKRIQSTSVQIPLTIPENTPAYAKGGEVVSLNGFNAKSFAGQMIVGNTPLTFCFIVNWNGPAEEFEPVQAAFFAAIKAILTAIKQGLQ